MRVGSNKSQGKPCKPIYETHETAYTVTTAAVTGELTIKPRNLFIIWQIVSLRKSADWLQKKLLLNSSNVMFACFVICVRGL